MTFRTLLLVMLCVTIIGEIRLCAQTAVVSFANNSLHYEFINAVKTDEVYTLSVENIPDSLYAELPKNFSHVETLIIKDTTLTEFGDWIGKYTSVFCILSYCPNLVSISEDIINCNRITVIKMHDSFSLTKIPESIFKLKSLECLEFSKAPIKIIPEEIGLLRKLEYLIFDSCMVDSISNCLVKCKKIKEVEITGSNLKSVPAFFDSFKKLTDLNLQRNKISYLPGSLRFRHLKHLDLGANTISTVPTNIVADCRNLTWFNIMSNQISYLEIILNKNVDFEHIDLPFFANLYSDEEFVAVYKKVREEHLTTIIIGTKD